MINKSIEAISHISPKYYGYKGGFANLTQCIECGLLGLYEDQHPNNPCRYCGGKINRGLVGRWVKPIVTYTWKWFFFKEKLSTVMGYWELKEE